MYKNNKNRGFTLIEFLFVALCLTLFLLAIFQVTIGGMHAFTKGMVQTELKHQLRKSLNRITTDLRQAVPDGPASFIFPPRDDSEIGQPYQELMFDRYVYSGTEMAAPTTATIHYYFGDGGILEMSGISYQLGILLRDETDSSGVTTTTRIADHIVLSIDDGTQTDLATCFMWQPLLDDAGDQIANNLSLMQIYITVARGEGKRSAPDILSISTDIAIRSESVLSAGFQSNRVMRFGTPSSLIKP